MGEASKSLTVSYGPFSCKVEGFADATEAAAAVRAVFHDLTQGDAPAAAARVPADQPDAAFEGLLARAEDAFARDDARHRHSLLGHLKAAVAATRAEAAAGPVEDAAPPDRMVARFRADLASAVAPHDGRAPSVQPPLPARAGQAPAAPPAPGFAAYAAGRDARALRDVLEAAAAYATEVEGQPAFSRRQILHHAATLGCTDPARPEAGLRAFGLLLREGRIVRAGDGLFALGPAPGGRA